MLSGRRSNEQQVRLLTDVSIDAYHQTCESVVIDIWLQKWHVTTPELSAQPRTDVCKARVFSFGVLGGNEAMHLLSEIRKHVWSDLRNA